MEHPEVLLVPLFMILDYTLTVLSQVTKERRYEKHFALEHQELNPIWQKDIQEKRWFNPRHLLAMMLTTAGLIYLSDYSGMPHFAIDFALGAILVTFGMIIGRHVSNLLIFRYVEKLPQEISGTVTLGHRAVLSLSLYQFLATLFPCVLIALFAPTPFAVGGVCGVALTIIVHLIWRWQYARRMRKAA
jgi:hypothetical protein